MRRGPCRVNAGWFPGRLVNTGGMARDDGAAGWMERNARRVGVAVLGGALLVVGVALLALPGPGMVVIVAGFAVLASEFQWAKSWLAAARRRARGAGDALRQRVRRDQG
jgi:uncharacterized protein (TIGR02611 family)